MPNLTDFALHRLGWKAFQDLGVALAEERLQRPVQTFLPTNDAGRDGAFLGQWDGNGAGESTIQCKFTSKEDHNLTLSDLKDELPKARLLAGRGLATDYIILTNHTITGRSELRIRDAFQGAGVGRCRVFHRDWIIARVHESAKLRMMVPRLYGLVDLSSMLDERAYRQAELILSEMGDNLQRLVVTEAHRKSVRAISEYNLVLLLGSPASGKSTIGASLALGAADIWRSSTIKSTSPDRLERQIDPAGGQFFWIDDAWGTTQFQRDRTEGWNQVFPLMQGAMKKGTRFLMTSRDYIWRQAQQELKLQALPVLRKSQVVINVHEMTTEEKARILYNHLKLGDQTSEFRAGLRELKILPEIAKSDAFLPETARRLDATIFTSRLPLIRTVIFDFFSRPKEFLEQTIENLAAECKAAIALVFLNGGQIRSPVPTEMLERPACTFGVTVAAVRGQLDALNGSLLNFAEDEEGPYWTYRHPTISDAFASYIAKSPEMIEIYLRGAKPETIVQEVVCAGIAMSGAPVVVPNSLHDLLVDRIANLPGHTLRTFISYRSNKAFSERMMTLRPDLWKRLDNLTAPLRDDGDVDLLTTLHSQGLLPEERRLKFVQEVRTAAINEADSSFLEDEGIFETLTDDERASILDDIEREVMARLPQHVDRVKGAWDSDYGPENHFDEFHASIMRFADALSDRLPVANVKSSLDLHIRRAVQSMEEDYQSPAPTTAPVQQSPAKSDSLDDLFRDIDE